MLRRELHLAGIKTCARRYDSRISRTLAQKLWFQAVRLSETFVARFNSITPSQSSAALRLWQDSSSKAAQPQVPDSEAQGDRLD